MASRILSRARPLALAQTCFRLVQTRQRRPLSLSLICRSSAKHTFPASSTVSSCCHKTTPPPTPSLTSLAFWKSPPTWRRAGVNTLRCLVGCSVGDFAVLWYLQTHHADWGMWPTIMGLAMASGLTTSVLLETVLLRVGRDGLSWGLAARTAVGMSFISMLTMELAENAVDYWLTSGGQAAGYTFGEPLFWAAAGVSMVAGFLAPLPYNYMRLRRYGKACH
ncbi:uncharacterized protein SPSK_06617 [Sporothrix schenckii 1099-18]|uniref:DUF4396 domain-containing protein n=1 Tax=Sporothrix schenckii 1099-18 TaxID=1397361 RepID=A0A0F2MK82_SPOSC|nr:uncharacterized protein SPSK_06617 [Sporothrix schenckii 1099-18]KJR90017.1 hypothetical protein SPSK_06617 [Sporothrix schenckii 1099-18]